MERFEQIYEEYRDAVRAFVRRRAPESVVEDAASATSGPFPALVAIEALDADGNVLATERRPGR